MANTTASSFSSANVSPQDGQPSFPLPPHPLRIDTETWQRDSHDLFDYEARSVQRCRFTLARHVRLMRFGTDIHVAVDGQQLATPPGNSADYLLNIKVKDGRYIIAPADRNVPTPFVPKKLWMIVKDLPEEQHVLQEGDIIKLGRFKLRVKQLARPSESDPVPELKLDDTEIPNSDVTEEEALTMQCRICLLEGGSKEDPLICPCQCKGSIKFVHVECLRHWINGRLNLTDEKRFFFKQLPCELCKQHFPSAIRLPDGERIWIVKVPQTQAPFIVLENIVGQNINRGIHVFSMAGKDELKLGRGHESDVRIPDVSISRYHATIRFNGSESKFTLDDHKSKFGTLVLLRRAHHVDYGDRFSVQVGRTVLKLKIDENAQSTYEIVVTTNFDPNSDAEADDAAGAGDAAAGGDGSAGAGGDAPRNGEDTGGSGTDGNGVQMGGGANGDNSAGVAGLSAIADESEGATVAKFDYTARYWPAGSAPPVREAVDVGGGCLPADQFMQQQQAPPPHATSTYHQYPPQQQHYTEPPLSTLAVFGSSGGTSGIPPVASNNGIAARQHYAGSDADDCGALSASTQGALYFNQLPDDERPQHDRSFGQDPLGVETIPLPPLNPLENDETVSGGTLDRNSRDTPPSSGWIHR